MTGISPDRLDALLESEQARFVEPHPRSRELHDRAQQSMVGGVPMQWMVEWAGAFPVFAREARGVRITDVDDNEYLDLCLGDTGAMFGHSPEPVAEKVRRRPAMPGCSVAGIGGTLTANALAPRAMRANLEEVMTVEKPA